MLSKKSRTSDRPTRMKPRYRWAAVVTVLIGGGVATMVGGPVSPASAAVSRLDATVSDSWMIPATRADLERQCQERRGTVTDAGETIGLTIDMDRMYA